jgi:hypothetical protein
MEVGQDRVSADCVKLVRREGRRVLLILNRRPQELALGGIIRLEPDVRARYVASFTGAILKDENYHVFSVEPVHGEPGLVR